MGAYISVEGEMLFSAFHFHFHPVYHCSHLASTNKSQHICCSSTYACSVLTINGVQQGTDRNIRSLLPSSVSIEGVSYHTCCQTAILMVC